MGTLLSGFRIGRRWRSKTNPVISGGAALLVVLCGGQARADFLSLEEAVSRAKSEAFSVAEARGEQAIAQSSLVGAKALAIQNPYLEVQAQAGRATRDVNINAFTAIPIELHGQRGSRIDEANTQIAWRAQTRREAEARAMGDVIAAYGDTLVAVSRADDARRGEEDAKRELEYYKQRLQASDATIVEKSLAEAEVARWSQTRAEADLRRVQALAALAQLTGVSEIAPPTVTDRPAIPMLRLSPNPSVIDSLVAQSPIVSNYEAQSAFFGASKERWQAEKNPGISLIVNGGRGDVGEARVGGGLAWTFPLTRRNQSEIAKAEAERSRAADLAKRARAIVGVRLRQAYEEFALSRAAVEEQDSTGIPAASRVVEASQAAYRSGKGELLRVFIARRDLATARARRIDLVQAAWHAYATLAALKGDWP